MREGSGARLRGRPAGALVPLFSVPSHRSWGIGEIPDLVPLGRWLQSAAMGFVQLLPVNEMQEGQSSPYSALSAMAIDPIFISLSSLPGPAVEPAPGERALLQEAREAPAIRYGAVRAAKGAGLRRAFASYDRGEWHGGSPDHHSLRQFCEEQAWWLDDYVLFRALHEHYHRRHWQEWDPPLRDREPAALREARERFARSIRYYEWLQWLAHEQWQRMRREAPVAILGDFPFMVSGHSADVWSRQDEFRIDVSVGVPPDAFSETGQDWGLPLYRWDVISARGDEWLRLRARRCADLYDGFRIDHLVGFYRTFFRTAEGEQFFDPPDQPAQQAQGERLLRVFAEPGARLIAEDLGVVPDFVRASIGELGIPGLKVFRWEREWDLDGHPFRNPAEYPAVSVAVSSTHDTESLADWWDGADADEREAALDVPGLRGRPFTPASAYSPEVRDALLDVLYAARSGLLILPLQDIFGWRDRINTPALVSDENWTWRLPWAVEDLSEVPDALERARFLRGLAAKHDRL
ncbi:MAG TPA: 4-alpha-glucanotransferase [Vicinamibacterales bacterium]|nr:4-alpha-glucanotransferase [Vicinamibacterales bacterium]